MCDLKVDLVHHLVVGLELIELHFEVRRRRDTGPVVGWRSTVSPWLRSGSTLPCLPGAAGSLAPPRHTAAAAAEPPGAAAQRGAVVSHVAAEGRREGEEGEGAKLNLALQDNGPGPYSIGRRQKMGPPCCAPAG